MFIAIIPKISILIFLSNLIKYTCISFIKINLLNNLIFSAILSILIGSILGLSQLRLKKLYAYSTINHIGYILIALAINSLESIKSFIFYLIQYSFLNLNIFIILYSLGYLMFIIKNSNITDKFNSPIQYIYQLKGYFYLNPILAICLCISLLSFIGIPPLIGFYGKQLILSSTIEAKKYFLVLLIIITSVISAIYYLNLIKIKFFIKPKLNITFFNLKLGFSLKDLYIYIHILQKIFFSIKLLKKLKYCNVLYTLSSNITIIIVIITILSLVYVCIHDRFIILINILSIYFI
jgi:NADH-ubiquinone oxidoreductase chain 2